MNCHVCNHPVPQHARYCPICQEDAGFPNVRAAQTVEESEALQRRVKDALKSAQLRNCESELNDFGQAMSRSKAVLTRSFGVVSKLISSDNELYNTYYQQVNSEARLPEVNPWDRGRPAVDAALFPYYSDKMVFAALSLDNQGLRNYGDYSIVLKDEMIKNRATVFEENSIVFCRQSHRIVVGTPLPPGYRALWNDRDKLAMAKLHSKIDTNTRPNDYPGILMTQGGESRDDDFIEVHIYGAIHRRAIERVLGPEPKKHYDKAIWKSVKRKLDEVNAYLEVS